MAPEDEVTPAAAQELLLDGGKGGAAALTAAELKRRRRKIAALLAILVALAIIVFIILRSLGGNSPLPGIPSELPHYVSDLYGAKAPMGVAVSPSGDRVYVTESEGRRLVRVYDGSGDQVDTLKPRGRKGKWRLPVYVAVDPQTEDVYVSDRLREVVDVYDPDGKYLRAFRPKGRLGKGANPLGLAFDPEGDLYMTDVSGSRKDHRVLVFGGGEKLAEKPLRKIGSRGAFWFPNGLALDGDGNLYVADSNDGRLAIYDPDGKLASSIQRGVGEGDLGLPRGVAIDGDRLFVVDTTSHTVKVYRLPGEVTEVPRYVGSFGIEGLGDGQFQYPNGIAIGGDGRIYVTDRENDRVQIWSY
jgi:DNA-binding beta-propeller fold protein YncE